MKMTAHHGNQTSVGTAVGSQDLADEQQVLLDLIDKLQYAQLDNVKLPQIVVVGDQSAGKSSVLEAITGTPFPREAGACTRFATEIRLRRAIEESFTIWIIPDKKNRTPAEQERLKRFGATVDASMTFEALMRLATDEIAPKGIPGRFAARDILVVEKKGPKLPILTVVDLPGLVRNANSDQSVDDIRAINDLTDHYMKSSRTIILAVVGGNNDYVQAPVLTKARHFDPSGGRTIGVLTKPDLTDSIGLEDKFIALVNNEDKHNHFNLGWYVLLNPGRREAGEGWPSPEERKQKEDAFFMTGKWSMLPQTMCGAAALKQKLSTQLQRHIAKHVRTIQKEIQQAHDACVAELKSLGDGKDTVEEMRRQLVQLCSDSEKLVTPAVDGTYKNPAGKSFFPKDVDQKGTPTQNLRARTVEENRRFAERVRTQGQKFHFVSGADPQAMMGRRAGSRSKHEYIKNHVERLLQQIQGTEFPLDHNPHVVYTLFQNYSENWSRLAQEHKNNLGVICNEFLAEVIDYNWPHPMREKLRTGFLDPQMKGLLEEAQKEVDVLRKDLQFEVQSYDPEYEERFKTWRAQAPDDSPYSAAEEYLEKMLIHYELSSKTFISNVITQVVERHLLQGLNNIFEPVKIMTMEDETVIAIAAEDKVTRDRRMTLKAKKADIEGARDICAGIAMRKELRSDSIVEADDAEESSEEDARGLSRANEHQQVNRKPSPMAESSTTTLRTPERPLSQEERTQRTPIRSSAATNGSFGPANDSGTAFSTETADQYHRARPDIPSISGGWNNPVSAEPHPSQTSPPQYAPPPPPRSEKINVETYQPLSPPNSGSRQQYPVQPPRPETNGHHYSNSYPQMDLNGAPTYVNDYPQSPVRKPQRKSLGIRT